MTTERIEELRKQFMNSSDGRIREMLDELDRQRKRIEELETEIAKYRESNTGDEYRW